MREGECDDLTASIRKSDLRTRGFETSGEFGLFIGARGDLGFDRDCSDNRSYGAKVEFFGNNIPAPIIGVFACIGNVSYSDGYGNARISLSGSGQTGSLIEKQADVVVIPERSNTDSDLRVANRALWSYGVICQRLHPMTSEIQNVGYRSSAGDAHFVRATLFDGQPLTVTLSQLSSLSSLVDSLTRRLQPPSGPQIITGAVWDLGVFFGGDKCAIGVIEGASSINGTISQSATIRTHREDGTTSWLKFDKRCDTRLAGRICEIVAYDFFHRRHKQTITLEGNHKHTILGPGSRYIIREVPVRASYRHN